MYFKVALPGHILIHTTQSHHLSRQRIWFTHDPMVHRERSSHHELWPCLRSLWIWKNGADHFLWALHLQPADREGAVKVTAKHPFQSNPCHCLEGNVPLLLRLLLFERQEISCTLPFQHSNTSCCIGQSTHVPLWVGRFNSPLLTSWISSLTGYVASSHFIATSWVKASGRWWA